VREQEEAEKREMSADLLPTYGPVLSTFTGCGYAASMALHDLRFVQTKHVKYSTATHNLLDVCEREKHYMLTDGRVMAIRWFVPLSPGSTVSEIEVILESAPSKLTADALLLRYGEAGFQSSNIYYIERQKLLLLTMKANSYR